MDDSTNYNGHLFGNYYLTSCIGQGGFADVYLGTHQHLNTKAAIKILQVRLLGVSTEQFRQEAQAIASLVHPHIIRVLDFGIQDDIPYLVMDYAPGGTLRNRHPREERLPVTTVVSYVQQIASALQYAHERKLIHRDVKPENVLLGQNNELLLSDFGLVLTVQSTRGRTTNEIAGTVAYMAPEQIHGKPRAASDQYALAIMAYEWLSGRPPFQGGPLEIYGQHLHAEPPALLAQVPTISPAIEQVIMQALAKNPDQRFTSIMEFANALTQAKLMPQSNQLRPMQLPSLGSSLGIRPANSEMVDPTIVKSGSVSSVPQSQPLVGNPWEATVMNTPAAQTQFSPSPVPQPNSQPLPSGYPSQPYTTYSYPSQPLPVPAYAPSYPQQASATPVNRSVSRRTLLISLAGFGIIGGGMAVIGAALLSQGKTSGITNSSTQPIYTPTPQPTPSPTTQPSPTVQPSPTIAPSPIEQTTSAPANIANGPAGPQTEWRWCNKCMGMAFAGYPANLGTCPATGAHDHGGSGNYKILANSPENGQANWRWCSKCMIMFYAGLGNQGVCPTGNGHDWNHSWNYSLMFNTAGAPGQNGWRFCHKCMGLFYGGLPNNQGICPAGGSHDSTGSGDYIIEGV